MQRQQALLMVSAAVVARWDRSAARASLLVRWLVREQDGGVWFGSQRGRPAQSLRV
jgi:hypothetical protein